MKKIFFLILALSFAQSSISQKIALTFDDAPVSDGEIFTGMERTSRIIQTLKKHQVKQAAFFVVTSHIDDDGLHRLKMYNDAGHLLANHSHSHQWIGIMGTAHYIDDIQRADSTLKKTKLTYQRWYRYPFLDEGGSKSTRDSIRAALASLSLMNAYVTIDDYDWCINNAAANAVKNKMKINYDELKKVYIEHIWNSIQFYNSIGRQVLGRSPKHVLLLHENDLAALFLGDLIQFLKNKGWKIISPIEAYSDPIAKEIPDVLFNGQGRIGAIAFSKGLAPASLVQESEDENYLNQLLLERRVFE